MGAPSLAPTSAPVDLTRRLWPGDDDPWLALGGAERFAEEALEQFDRHVETRRSEPIVRWRTVVDPNAFAWRAYVRGHGRDVRPMSTGAYIRHLDNVIAGHAMVAAAIRRQRPGDRIAIGLAHDDVYESGALLVDLLELARLSIEPADVRAHLVARRARWYASQPAGAILGRARRRFVASIAPLEQAFPRTLSTVLGAAGTDLLDELHLSSRRRVPAGLHAYDDTRVFTANGAGR